MKSKTNFKKLLSIALACVMMVVSIGYTLSNIKVADAEDGTICLVENADGTYVKASAMRSIFGKSGIIVKSVDDSEIYKVINEENYLLEVIAGTYMPVEKEVFNKSTILRQDLETEYRVEILEAIEVFCDGENEGTLTVYTPRLSNGYIGYAGKTYYQDFLVYDFDRGERKTISSDVEWAGYVEKISEGINHAIDIGGIFVSSPKVTVALLIFNEMLARITDDLETRLANTIHEATLNEDKYVKHIYMMSDFTSTLNKYVEVERAVYNYQNEITIGRGANSIYEDYRSEDGTIETENYSTSEEKAYSVMRTGVIGYFHIEKIRSYKYQDTIFSSGY